MGESKKKKLKIAKIIPIAKEEFTVKMALEEVLKEFPMIKNVMIVYEMNDGRQMLRSSTMSYSEKNVLSRFLEAFCLKWFKFSE